MRQPYQVLIFPYKKEKEKIVYAIFLREDLKVWQGIAGGVEENETPLLAAKRESLEEANISKNAKFITLDSYTTMPVVNVAGKFAWGKDIFLIKEFSYGVNAQNEKIKISDEHIKYEWLSYEKAIKKLKWDSNKSALWELNERLIKEKE